MTWAIFASASVSSVPSRVTNSSITERSVSGESCSGGILTAGWGFVMLDEEAGGVGVLSAITQVCT